MANEMTPVVWDDATNKHRPLGTGEKMGGLDASSILSSDSGNLIQTGSDGLAYLSGGSIADPRADNLLEESANGKLQVTADRIVEWLGLNPSDAEKIAGALAAKMAGELADGQTITASGGKLHSDPTNATAAQKKKINEALADADSGLVVDPSTGRLGVDFSNMPTDKFEELLKGLKMKVPLSSNMSVYVSIANSAAGDDIVDGRGTQAKPFKHIQAAVNYVTSTYSLGSRRVDIYVAAGTYPENVVLPAYDRGTGAIYIRTLSGARDVVVEAQTAVNGTVKGNCLNATGGVWHLELIDAVRVESPSVGSGGGGSTGCYQAFGAGAELWLHGCAARQSIPAGTFGGNAYSVRVISADGGGVVRFRHGPGGIPGLISTQQGAGGTTPNVTVLHVARGGAVWLGYEDDPATSRDINCSGSCGAFLSMSQAGAVNTQGSGELVRFVNDGMTGARFRLTGGSHVAGLGGDQTYFPGDSIPSDAIEASTYCWYQ